MATLCSNLPKEIALASSVNSFKSRLDKHLGRIRGRLVSTRNGLLLMLLMTTSRNLNHCSLSLLLRYKLSNILSWYRNKNSRNKNTLLRVFDEESNIKQRLSELFYGNLFIFSSTSIH